MKRIPTGWVAVCQCGVNVGALDRSRTDPTEARALLSKWLADGCRIEPKFTDCWRVDIGPCGCSLAEKGGAS